MATRSQSDSDVEPFEDTLNHVLIFPGQRKPIQALLEMLRLRSLPLSEYTCQRLATMLQKEYSRRSARIEDKRSLQILNEQYSNVQYFVTPVHRLPVEILIGIFHFMFDNHPSLVVLMLVCRRWYNAIEAMPGLQIPLKLRTWTTPEVVRRATSGAASRVLRLTVDTNQDAGLGGPSVERYSAIVIAIESASQWRSLMVHSLPKGGQLDDSALRGILSMDIPPMIRLEELKITSEVEPSPLVDRLLQNIAATAMGGLTTMEINSSYSFQSLHRVTSTHTFHSLTTLRVVLRKMSEPIDILPRFPRLEVLDATNLFVPSYQSDSPLPFIQTLRLLYLKSVSVGWMAGQMFPHLAVCTIITPPSPFLALDVYLPTCKEFHFDHRSTALFRRFQVPMVSSLVVNGNHWTPLQGSQGLLEMCMAGLGTVLRPRVLRLAILCNGSVLLMALQHLPALEELNLELPRPSALGRGFFTSLLARPTTIPYDTVKSEWFEWAEKQNDWHATICPSLRVFNLHYQRWLRPGERIGFVSPLLALGWTRKKTGMPLQTSCVHMRANSRKWGRVELVPEKPQALIELDIPHLEPLRLKKEAFEFVFRAYLTSAALSVIDKPNFGNCVPYVTEAFFGRSFSRIRVLSIQGDFDGKSTLNVLHCFHHLEGLSLTNVRVSLYPHDNDLPLLQTLQRLSIHGGCAKWLDGHTFVKIASFSVMFISPWRDSFPNRVNMPACTHIFFDTNSLEFLPMFQSAFIIPRTDEWNLQRGALCPHHFRGSTQGMADALSKICARVLRLSIATNCQHLIMVIQSRYELEELSIRLSTNFLSTNKFLISLTDVIVDYPLTKTTNTSFDTETIPKLATATNHTCHVSERKIICPNLKVLDLQFWEVEDEERGVVRQRCIQMMEGRRRAGFPLDRCCIWWHRDDREKDPSLVLFTSNEGIIG